MRIFEITRLVLALTSMITILWVTEGSAAQTPSKKPSGSPKSSEKLISMVIEPVGNQLKIFLTGSKSSDIKMSEAVVEASYFVDGKQKTLTVQRQTDAKSRKSFYLIDKFDKNMKNLKINVKVANHSETFDLPDLQ